LTYLCLFLLHALSRGAPWAPPGFSLLRRLSPPLCLLAASIAGRVILPEMNVVSDAEKPGLNMLVIGLGAWCVITGVSGLRYWLHAQFDINQADNLRARGVHTQLGFIEKLIDLAVVISAVAAILYQVSWGRMLGTSLIASAGVASLIIGLAAQKTLTNLIAGFQIAFTQPIRLDDAVVVEDEWGWVEEITLTYVVVRIWDKRRLVLPITHFIEKPFQNWTRTSGQILGSVHLVVSHGASFDALERRFNELLEASERWDGEARVLQVVDCDERHVTLRALMTARDSPTCWDLRCEVRRGLLEFINQHHPDALPHLRVRLLTDAAAPETRARPADSPVTAALSAIDEAARATPEARP
jgi:small-conductance mechanosensitive channel